MLRGMCVWQYTSSLTLGMRRTHTHQKNRQTLTHSSIHACAARRRGRDDDVDGSDSDNTRVGHTHKSHLAQSMFNTVNSASPASWRVWRLLSLRLRIMPRVGVFLSRCAREHQTLPCALFDDTANSGAHTSHTSVCGIFR